MSACLVDYFSPATRRIYRTSDIEAACERMHERLVCVGRLQLAGGNGPREQWESDPDRTYYDYGGREYDDAKRLQGLIAQLPRRQHSVLLLVFYADDEVASGWAKVSATYKEMLARRVAGKVNGILDAMGKAEPVPYRLIDWRDIDGIRERAIRQLVNRELMLPDNVADAGPAENP